MVYYCFENIWDPILNQWETQFIITYVVPDYWDHCQSLPPAQLINGAIQSFMSSPGDPGNVQTYLCGEGYATTFEYQVSDCWTYWNGTTSPPPPGATCVGPSCAGFYACTSGTSWCQTTCQYCQSGVVVAGPNEGQPVLSEISCSSTSGYNGDCNNVAPNLFSQWIPANCYNINPCGN